MHAHTQTQQQQQYTVAIESGVIYYSQSVYLYKTSASQFFVLLSLSASQRAVGQRVN